MHAYTCMVGVGVCIYMHALRVANLLYVSAYVHLHMCTCIISYEFVCSCSKYWLYTAMVLI